MTYRKHLLITYLLVLFWIIYLAVSEAIRQKVRDEIKIKDYPVEVEYQRLKTGVRK